MSQASPNLPPTPRSGSTRPALLGVILTLGACVAVWYFWLRPPGSGYIPGNYPYQYGRKLSAGEKTYGDYRKQHMDEAKTPTDQRDTVALGMDTWYWWTGGGQHFWREISKETSALPIKVDLLAMLHSTPRGQRFQQLGVMNDPDCVAAEKPDEYGLMIDRMKDGTQRDYAWKDAAGKPYDAESGFDEYGWSSGIIGLRLFKNPKFAPEKWSLRKYLSNPAKIEPPYLVGMSCALCHVSFNPLAPPKDPNEPAWDNLASMIGNQYLREGRLFAGINKISPDQFTWHYIETQQPGTSETSRLDTDFINNPNVINSVYRLKERLRIAKPEAITPAQKKFVQAMYRTMGIDENTHLGGTDTAPTLLVPRVLKDGSDSMGVPLASLRVWVNIGSMHEQWMKTWAINPANLKESIARGFRQTPFEIAEAQKDPNSFWNQTTKRMPALEQFALSSPDYPLAKAKETPGQVPDPNGTADEQPEKAGPDGISYLSTDAALLRKGKVAFARNCASCHSSKRPDNPNDPAAWEALVLKDDFLVDNYLSDDERHPVSELKTNAARAMGTNPQTGEIWDNFSSQTFKDQRAADGSGVTLQDFDAAGNPVDLFDPRTGKNTRKFTVPNQFAPSYRTPTLVSVWATAPYLHNNSVGMYTGDPSIAGRMAAFEDGMQKLLSPELRLKERSIKVMTQDCHLPGLLDGLRREIPALRVIPQIHLVRIPRGTPVNLLANLHARDAVSVLEAFADGVLDGQTIDPLGLIPKPNFAGGMKKMADRLFDVNQCPDFIEDKGHEYGRELPPEDKRALIEFMKTF